MQDRPRILLFGTWGEDNAGDDNMLISLIKGLRARNPGCRLICFSENSGLTRALLERELSSLEGIQVVYTAKHGFLEPDLSFPQSLWWQAQNVSAIFRCQLLLIGPGNQIQDATRRLRLLFFLSRALFAGILKTPLIGLTSRIFLPKWFPSSMSWNFEVCLAELLRWITKNLPAGFRFFPFYRGNRWNDSVSLERLKFSLQDIRFPVEVFPFTSFSDLREGIDECDALIGVRYHSVLLAVQEGVRPLGISYAHKTRRLMEENGLGDCVLDVEDLTFGRLKQRWERLWRESEKIPQFLPGVCAYQKSLALQHFGLIFRAISNRKPRAGMSRSGLRAVTHAKRAISSRRGKNTRTVYLMDSCGSGIIRPSHEAWTDVGKFTKSCR